MEGDAAALAALAVLEPEGWALQWDPLEPDRMIWTLGTLHGVTLLWPGFDEAQIPHLLDLLRKLYDVPGLYVG